MSNDSSVDFTSLAAYRAGVFIWRAVPPVLIVLGTVGNVLSILVLTRRPIRSSTTALYLAVLAVSDLVVLYSGLLRQWLRFLLDYDVRHVSNAGCKINIWIVYTSLDFSAWILIAVTLERVISAWLPHNARTTCTKKSAIALMTSILVFLLLLNSHMLYGMGFQYDENGEEIESLRCTEVDTGYVHFFNKEWPWIDLCAFCLVPCSVIIVGNSLILFKVIKSQKKTKSRVVPTITTGVGAGARTGPAGKHSSMTAMLFTLNVVFLVSTSPVSIYNIGYAHWAEKAELSNDSHAFAQLDLWWAIVNMLMYTNNSLNFLLYCLSGTKFRREVVRMFCTTRGAPPSQPPSNYTRTKFDPSTAPNSKRLSGTSATSANGKAPAPNDEEKRISAISGNLLHPDTALQIYKAEVGEDHPVAASSDV